MNEVEAEKEQARREELEAKAQLRRMREYERVGVASVRPAEAEFPREIRNDE